MKINNLLLTKANMERTLILLKIYLIAFLLLVACDDSSVNEPETPQNNFEILSSSGKVLNMNGEWNADCTPVGDAFLKESFIFSGDSLIITIENFGLSDCSGTPFRTDMINITYEPKGTFNVSLDGHTVNANKISGTSFYNGSSTPEAFKQTFYIDDSQTIPILYHGVFGDDGGKLSSDGYPLELHNVAIIKQ